MSKAGTTPSRSAEHESARRVALNALVRIESEGAYANLVLGPLLDRSHLSREDRNMATMLVYGTTRLRRACDSLVNRFVAIEPDVTTRQILRLGAFQIAFAGTPAHAAVAETVSLAPARTRGFVNAVLRKVATHPISFASAGDRLSYPDWIIERFESEMPVDIARASLETMNRPAVPHVRADGYIQDRASADVVHAVAAAAGEVVVDLCAGPGGKATGLAATGAHVIACDVNSTRSALVRDNARLTNTSLAVVTTNGTAPPFRPGSIDRVLVDAPCSGLGVLRRRADARWRITSADVDDLARLQRELIEAAARLVRPGGHLIYSVCTVTRQESIDHPIPEGFHPLVEGEEGFMELPSYWKVFGHGWRVLPHEADTDGMILLRYRRCA